MGELTAPLGEIVKPLAARHHTPDNAVPEERPLGRLQILNTPHLRQPAVTHYVAERAYESKRTTEADVEYCERVAGGNAL